LNAALEAFAGVYRGSNGSNLDAKSQPREIDELEIDLMNYIRDADYGEAVQRRRDWSDRE
jgi:hypothetical protein